MLPGLDWGRGSGSCSYGRLFPTTVANSGYNFLTLIQRLQKEGGRFVCTGVHGTLTANPYCLGIGEQLVSCVLLAFAQSGISFLWKHRSQLLDLICISQQ